MSKKKIAVLEIENKEFYLIPVMNFLDGLAARHENMDVSRYNHFRFAVSEILRRRITEAYPDKNGILRFEVYLSEKEFEISIWDKGLPYWYDDFYVNTVNKAEGMNQYIMDQFVDNIGIEKLGKDGQRIFVKMRILNPIKFVEPEPYEEIEVLDTNISIRQVLTKEDVMEAIRCIYSEYGYDYGHEELYYVDGFMNQIKNGNIMSFLAVNDHGQVAGHFALIFSEKYKGMPDISTVVIRNEFRGLGLFSRFLDYCFEIGKKEKFRAFMGEPVAYHPMSQKAVLKSGFTPTAVLLSYLDPKMPKAYSKDDQRMDIFASVKILDPEAESCVYPPLSIVSLVRSIYDGLGWKYEILQPEGMSDTTRISIEDNNLLKMKTIIINEASDDLKEMLESAVNNAIRDKHEMIELMLSMRTPSCEYAYNVAKQSGFVLSGLMPGGQEDDYIIMQKLMGKEPDYSRLVSVGKFEKLTEDVIALAHKK